MTVKITGLRELISGLAKKESDILAASKKANQAGGKVIGENLKNNVPRSGYSGANPQTRLADAVVVSGNRSNNSTYESYVAVGFSSAANFRAHIPEFGSISQGPQGYMAKTVQQSESQIPIAMAKAIRGVLG